MCESNNFIIIKVLNFSTGRFVLRKKSIFHDRQLCESSKNDTWKNETRNFCTIYIVDFILLFCFFVKVCNCEFIFEWFFLFSEHFVIVNFSNWEFFCFEFLEVLEFEDILFTYYLITYYFVIIEVLL